MSGLFPHNPTDRTAPTRTDAELAHARAVADLFAEQPNRPADLMSPDRKRAIREHRCHCPPLGCGLPVRFESFDELGRVEYRISALCPRCQRAVFEAAEADALADIEADAD